jgi:DNA invertase Pin-like site-specific DNA recombinase
VTAPLRDDPHEQLVTQIRGAVAEYERTLIADQMRRGRQARLRSGQLLPWTRAPYGYRLHPERPRDPAAVQLDPVARPPTPSASASSVASMPRRAPGGSGGSWS